jgi:MFS family permease
LEPGKEIPSQQKKTLIAVSVTMAIMSIGMGFIAPILPKLAQSLGASSTMVGIIISTRGVSRLLTDLPTGRLADRKGRRWLVVGAPGLVIAGAVASALATSVWQLFVFRVVQAAGTAIMHTMAYIMLADVTLASQRGRVLSIYQVIVLPAAAVGPYLGGLLSERFGLRAPFFGMAVIGAIACLWAYLRIPESRAATIQEIKPSPTGGHRPSGGTSALLLNTNFLLVSLLALSIFFSLSGGRDTLVPLLGYNTLLLGEAQVGLAFSLTEGLVLAIVYLGGRMADRLGRKAVLVPGAWLMVIAILVFSRSGDYATYLLGAGILGAGWGLSGAIPTAYAADISPPEKVGSTLGLFRFVGAIGLLLGPILMGWLADIWGISSALWINAVMLLATSLLFATLARETLHARP